MTDEPGMTIDGKAVISSYCDYVSMSWYTNSEGKLVAYDHLAPGALSLEEFMALSSVAPDPHEDADAIKDQGGLA